MVSISTATKVFKIPATVSESLPKYFSKNKNEVSIYPVILLYSITPKSH